MTLRQTLKSSVLFLLLNVHLALAFATNDRSEHMNSQSSSSVVDYSEAQQAQGQASDWGLSDVQWQRYLVLKQGQRGLWSPRLDPIEVLGVEAETEQDRRYYAELHAVQYMQRLEKELAFERERLAAIRRLFPDMPVIDTARLPPGSFKRDRERGAMFQTGDHLVYLLTEATMQQPFPTHQQLLQRVLSIIGERKDLRLTLYFIGQSDDAIQQWAQRQHLPSELSQQGRLQLQPTSGSAFHSLAKDRQQDKAWFIVRDGQWHQLALSMVQ